MAHPANSVTLSGKSGASSGKAEDEGVAGSYVEDENAVRGVIWLAGTHGYFTRQATRWPVQLITILLSILLDRHQTSGHGSLYMVYDHIGGGYYGIVVDKTPS